MSVPLPDVKALCLMSGNVCAFPDCGERLVLMGANGEQTIVGEISHIVAENRQGPRGASALSDEERNRADNLILVCSKHHKVIDDHPHIYSVEVLRQIKLDHQRRIAQATERPIPVPSPILTKEQVHSTLLKVTSVPAFVYAAPCGFNDKQVKEVAERIHYPPEGSAEIVPFLLRDKKLYAFHDLRKAHGPFDALVDARKTEPIPARNFWSDEEGRRRFVDLLNRSLRRHCAVRRVRYDNVHRRYHFCALIKGEERLQQYHTLTGKSYERLVVWQPKKRKTGEARSFWCHLAAGLRFHQMANDQWCLSIRPERHLTKDSEAPLEAELVGRKVTRLKARMFNAGYLSEIQFWRDFLSDGKPRFILNFGRQSCIVETELISVPAEWPGIPGDSKSFTHQVFEEDLFSFAELASALGDKEDDWEEKALNDADDDDED